MYPALRFFKSTAVVLLIAAIASPVLQAQSGNAPDASSKTVRLLNIGNSFSHNAVHYLPDLAKATGRTVVLRELIIGGASMERHWQVVEAGEKDPKSKEALYGTKKTLQQELESGPWDFVSIQQASIKSHDISHYRPFGAQLQGFVKKHAPGAELVLHQTWEYRVDDPRFTPKEPVKAGEPVSQNDMHEKLTNAYGTIANELGVRLVPVGDAFHMADTDAKWGYKTPAEFNPKTAKAPPEQTHSLHMGWQSKKQPDGSMKIVMDGHHANVAGEYLGACVWYEFLFKDDVTNNTFVPKGLDSEYAKFLRQTAHRTLAESR